LRLTEAQFIRAIAETESGNNPLVKPGDGGKAIGRYQQHPAFVQQWTGRKIWPVEWTWDAVFYDCLSAFYVAATTAGIDAVTAAVGYNLHGQPRASVAEVASDPYAERFRDACARLNYAL
jgi:hypothetical protein